MPEPNLKNDPLVRRVICGGSRNGVERLIAFPCVGNAWINPAIKPMRSVSIVVVDDHPVVLRGLITLLSEDKMFKVIGSCNDGAEAIDIIRNLKPCIALLDMKMPTNGLQVLKAVTADKIPTRICFLAAFLTDQEIVAATAGGVHGIVLKETAPETLISCLHAVAAGQKWLPINLVDGALRRTLESAHKLPNWSGCLRVEK